MYINKFKAVSYVEIILVLTIIGVVASVSLPVLKKHSQKSEFGALAQKAYLTLSDVVDNSIVLNGPSRNWTIGETVFNDYFVPSFNYATHSDNVVITKDKMRFSAVQLNAASIRIDVDINGDQTGPNLAGKDIHNFEFFYNTAELEPVNESDTAALAQNGWRYTDELWNN